MSVVWNDEYDPDELGDGFRIETNLSVEDVQDELWMDAADAWLAAQDVPDWMTADDDDPNGFYRNEHNY